MFTAIAVAAVLQDDTIQDGSFNIHIQANHATTIFGRRYFCDVQLRILSQIRGMRKISGKGVGGKTSTVIPDLSRYFEGSVRNARL